MEEKRAHQRVPLNADVALKLSSGDTHPGTAKDISMGGMFIETEGTFEFAENVTVRCRLPTADNELDLPGVVRWTKPGGIGIQFGLLGARETHAIAQLMKQ